MVLVSKLLARRELAEIQVQINSYLRVSPNFRDSYQSLSVMTTKLKVSLSCLLGPCSPPQNLKKVDPALGRA